MAKRKSKEVSKKIPIFSYYTPEAGMTLRTTKEYLEKNVLSKPNHRKTILALQFSHPDFGLTTPISSDETEKFHEKVLHMYNKKGWMYNKKGWLRGYSGNDNDKELLGFYKNNDKAKEIVLLEEKLFDQMFDDYTEIQAICDAITSAYSDFLVETADHVFTQTLELQLLWIDAAKRCDNECYLQEKPLALLKNPEILHLIEKSISPRFNKLVNEGELNAGTLDALQEIESVMKALLLKSNYTHDDQNLWIDFIQKNENFDELNEKPPLEYLY